jgi:hypothetical protein
MFDPNAVPFTASTLNTYNVFESARKLGRPAPVHPHGGRFLPNLKPPTRFRFKLLGQEMVFRECVLRVSYVFSVMSECSSSSSSWSSSVYTPKERCLAAP